MFWNETEALVAQQCEVLTATELFTCKRLISHYANFTSLKLKKKKSLPRRLLPKMAEGQVLMFDGRGYFWAGRLHAVMRCEDINISGNF